MNRRVVSLAAAALAAVGLASATVAPAQAAPVKVPVSVAYHWDYSNGALTVSETLTHAVNGKVVPLVGAKVVLVCSSASKQLLPLGTQTTNAAGTVNFTNVPVDAAKYPACAVGFAGDATDGPAVAAFDLSGKVSTIVNATTGSNGTTTATATTTTPAGTTTASETLPAGATVPTTTTTGTTGSTVPKATTAAPAAPGTQPGLSNTGGVA